MVTMASRTIRRIRIPSYNKINGNFVSFGNY